jgi:RNA polymerase sigma factor (sigma-70 family)
MVNPYETAAFELRKQYYDELVVHAMHCGCPMDETRHVANDALAELFIRQHDPTAAPIEKPRSWLYKVVRHKAIRLGRERSRRRTLTDEMASSLVARTLGPQQHAELMEVFKAIRTLPAGQRMAMTLSIDGYSTAEIAEILCCSPESVRQHISRARKILRRKFDY